MGLLRVGLRRTFKKVPDTSSSSRDNFILMEKWKGSKGNTWYKELDILVNGMRFFFLDRISKDGNVSKKHEV